MKRIMIVLALAGAMGILSGCEKETGCENYNPWPSADAVAAWKAYSPGAESNSEAYNSVSGVIGYLGSRIAGYDSTILQNESKEILIRGYLYGTEEGKELGVYLITDVPGAPYSHLNTLSVLFPTGESVPEVDTTKEAFLKAHVRVYSMEKYRNEYPNQHVSPCSQWGYALDYAEVIKNKD